MIGDLFDSPWKILIVAVVLIVLFGSKKLPDAARSLGRSMRILKAEVQDLHHDDAAEAVAPAPALSASQQQIDQLQQQIRDLQRQEAAGGTATVNGAPLGETQRTQQPGLSGLPSSYAMSKLGDTVTGARVLGTRFVASQRQANPEGRMPLMDHIRELRNRVVKAAAALLVGVGVGLIPAVFDRVWSFVEHPFCAAVINGKQGCHVLGDQLVINGVFDPFMLRVQIAFFFGLIVTCPIWLYQLWAFIAPGLYHREKRWTYAFVGTAVPLFLAGAAIAYYAMSRGLRYLLGLTPHGVVNLPPVSTYLGYFWAMLLGFGLAFELPLAMVILNLAGILTHERFRKWRRMIIFLVFVFAGIASPSPDPLTMLLLAVPCVVLVEVAEVVIWATDRRRANRPGLYAGLGDDELSPLDLDAPPRDGVDAGRSPGPDA